jgi:hypothetical protein
MDYFFIAPAGSNISYIRFILSKYPLTQHILSYHTIPNVDNLWTHDLDYPVNDKCIKIYFEKYIEIIILNWNFKFRITPADEINPSGKSNQYYGKEWKKTQKHIWGIFKEKWDMRATLHWLYKIFNDKKYSVKIESPGKNFNGASLYEGYESAKEQFSEFRIEYSMKQYTDWKDSQQVIFNSWAKIKECKNITDVDFLDFEFEKGIALGLIGITNNMSEDIIWKKYVK